MSIDTPEAAGNGVDEPGLVENQTPFRAVPDHASLHGSLGPLANLPGRCV